MKAGISIVLICLIGLLSFTLWSSAADPVKLIPLSKAALEEIEARKILYKKRKTDECRAIALDRAAAMVDSALLEQALFIGADTLARPERPDRPFAESFSSNIENIPIKPFLKRRDFVSPFQKKDTFALDSLKLRDSIKIK